MIVGGTIASGLSRKAHKTYLRMVQNVQLTSFVPNIARVEHRRGVVDDHLQTMSIEEQRMVAEPVEGLEEILLDNSRPNQMTRIGTLASPPIRQELTTFLRENQDVFAWSHEDMPRIDPSIMVHRLNVSPSFPPYPAKEKSFCPRARQGYSRRSSQVAKGRIHKRSILSRLVGQCSDSQESQRKMEDVCRLHELK